MNLYQKATKQPRQKKMKLLVTKINNASAVIALAKQFYCNAEAQEEKIIITKNPQLTGDEFSVLAGKLVMAGFNLELI